MQFSFFAQKKEPKPQISRVSMDEAIEVENTEPMTKEDTVHETEINEVGQIKVE